MAEERRHRRSSTAPLITSEDLEALTPEWEALHAAVPAATPFTHPAWHATWLRHFGHGVSPVFLSIRDEEALIGVAALDIGRDGARQLGDPNVCDYAGLLVAPGREAEACRGVIEWLMEDLTTSLEMWGVGEGSEQRAGFESGAAFFGWSYAAEPEAVAPVAALPSDFDAFVGGLGKHDRHELRRKLRNLGAAGAVAFESVTSSDAIERDFDLFLEMMRMSRDDKDEFLTPIMEAFFRDLATTFGALRMARLSTLAIDDEPAAMLLSFENAETTFLYNSGYDPQFGPLAVGLLSKAYAVEDSIKRGKKSFDFLRGDEEYKRRLGGVPKEVFRLVMRSR